MTTGTSATPAAPRQVVFVHGLWLHARSWQCWVKAFREAGYEAGAPGWPGEMSDIFDTRAQPNSIADAGFDELVRHYAEHVAGATPPPVLIGHMYGARLVYRLVELGLASGGIAIAADGRPPPGEIGDARTRRLTRDAFADYYGGRISREESDQLYERWAIPAPRAAVDGATSAVSADGGGQALTPGPFLLIAAGHEDDARGLNGDGVTDVRRFPDRGRSLTIDSRWPEIAESCLAWLDAQEL